MALRTQTLSVSFLWSDLGWFHLRLVPAPDGKGWVVMANAESGPWHGGFCAQRSMSRPDLAGWMAGLTPEDAYALLAAHPAMAAARVALHEGA